MSKMSYGTLSKKLQMKSLKSDLESADHLFVTSFAKIATSPMDQLRKTLRDQETKFKVVKNSIARIALNEKGCEGLGKQINSQCGIGIASGEVAPVAKSLVEFSKEHEGFDVKALLMDGQVYDFPKIKELADLPSRDVMLGRVCGQMMAPISGFARALNGVLCNFVNVIDQIKKKKS